MFDVSVVLQTIIALIALLTGIGFIVRLLLAPIRENQARMEAELKSNQARMEGDIKELKALLTKFLEKQAE